MARRLVLASLAIGVALVAAGTASARTRTGGTGAVGCPPGAAATPLSADYKAGIEDALASPTDFWGDELVSRPEGPTYDAVRAYLRPIWWAIGGPTNRKLTDSGTYYVPFGQPAEAVYRGPLALHAADGSQITSNRAGRSSMRIFVGETAAERFGECRADLEAPRLLGGYLPALETAYRDYDGIRYRQESFAGFLPGTHQVASYVELAAAAAGSYRSSTTIRFELCRCRLTLVGNRAVARGRTYAFVGAGASVKGGSVQYDLDLSGGEEHAVYLVRLVLASRPRDVEADGAAHTAARAAMAAFWNRRLARGIVFSVPEPLVMDAQRNLLIQNLLMTIRYSLGNPYEDTYQPESSDTVETLGRYGFTGVYRKALDRLLRRSKGRRRRNWERGEKLLRAADYYWLTRDRRYIAKRTALYVRFAADMARQHRHDPHHLLERQRYSSDVRDHVYGVHQIARALLGLKAIVAVWRATNYTRLARRFSKVSRSLDAGFRHALRRSGTMLGDGSLFTPAALLTRERPYRQIPATVRGSYWNLVAPYAFSAQIYPPGSDLAFRTLAYLYGHGSRLLGHVRSHDGGFVDTYGVEQAKFLADNGQADQLVLSLYGNLAHGRAPGTFIGGEVSNFGPLAQRWPRRFGTRAGIHSWSSADVYRGMYSPPNAGNNTLFLYLLRTMLVYERTSDSAVPTGLELAPATPRRWLTSGNTITVRAAPTEFGAVSYSIRSAIDDGLVAATVDPPTRQRPPQLALTLRVPSGRRMIAVTVNGRPYHRFDPVTETIDLSGLERPLRVEVRYRSAAGSELLARRRR